jgi:hypothetical protein
MDSRVSLSCVFQRFAAYESPNFPLTPLAVIASTSISPMPAARSAFTMGKTLGTSAAIDFIAGPEDPVKAIQLRRRCCVWAR